MYGGRMGNFLIWTQSWTQSNVDSWVVRFEQSGKKGDAWRNVVADLGPGDKQVVLLATGGNGYTSP